jgi:zinc/manganese transport system substrate-binding protein
MINAQDLLHLPITTPNPHLWYSPKTMPVVAAAMAGVRQAAARARRLLHGERAEVRSRAWSRGCRRSGRFKAKYAGTPVATTEPVADYLLQAMGVDNLTPFSLQADIMNGTDPSPQGISNQDALFSRSPRQSVRAQPASHRSADRDLRTDAQQAKIPVVGVYETMPTGYSYQSWMLAELEAIEKAVSNKISTATL